MPSVLCMQLLLFIVSFILMGRNRGTIVEPFGPRELLKAAAEPDAPLSLQAQKFVAYLILRLHEGHPYLIPKSITEILGWRIRQYALGIDGISGCSDTHFIGANGESSLLVMLSMLFSVFNIVLWCSPLPNAFFLVDVQYSTVDPNLPTFHPSRLGGHDEGDHYEYDHGSGQYIKLKPTKEKEEESLLQWAQSHLSSIVSGSGERAKEFLRKDSVTRATSKKMFLPDERTSMVTFEETDQIIQRSFEYIVALMEFNLVTLNFQLNHYLYEGFKTELSKSFQTKLVNDADWDKLVEPDPSVALRLQELKEQIIGLTDSLREVERMQRKMP